MKVDVVMCTWNSNKPWFKSCLAAIKREVPFCHFIVVDRFSVDGTVEVVKRFFPKALIIESEAELGKARQEATKHVDTEWLVFVDSDIELGNNWFKIISGYLTRNIGAVAGIALPTKEYLKKLELYKKPSEPKTVVSTLYLSNTILRTSLVKDWSPSKKISASEDMHLSRHVTNKGYSITILNELYVKHHGRWGFTDAEKILWHYSGARLVGVNNVTTKQLIRRLFSSPLYGLLTSFRLKEPQITPYIIFYSLINLKGWLQWDKYRVLKR
jgi:glycosyltransferase involved in cell wall biosynthesis